MHHFDFRQNLIVPGITNQMGVVPFETDMLVITKSGKAYGFEIKVSKSDLKADFRKPQHNQDTQAGFERYYKKFKYFYYAIPLDMREFALSMIPDFCGLVCIEKRQQGTQIIRKLTIEKAPKKLFDYTWGHNEQYEVARLGTMRQYTLMHNIANYFETIKQKEG